MGTAGEASRRGCTGIQSAFGLRLSGPAGSDYYTKASCGEAQSPLGLVHALGLVRCKGGGVLHPRLRGVLSHARSQLAEGAATDEWSRQAWDLGDWEPLQNHAGTVLHALSQQRHTDNKASGCFTPHDMLAGTCNDAQRVRSTP